MTADPSIRSERRSTRPVVPGADAPERLRDLARQVRMDVVRMAAGATGGHPGGSLSCADILVALYFSELDVRPDDPAWPERDRFVLSKGHASEALYATLALRGYFPREELATFGQVDSRLQGHPDMTRLPALDMSTGALGAGFSAAVGMALGSRMRGTPERTFVLLGDGECQEGEVWEAAWFAARYRLDNLVAVVDFNSLQQVGWPGHEPGTSAAPWDLLAFASQWEAAGWAVQRIDGHEPLEILRSLDAAQATKGRPVVIIASTVKGKGVSFMEGRAEWHSRVPTREELALALGELGAGR
jgi:transketolase